MVTETPSPLAHYGRDGLLLLRATANAVLAMRVYAAALHDSLESAAAINAWTDAGNRIQGVADKTGQAGGHLTAAVFDHRRDLAAPQAREARREALAPLLAPHDTRWRTVTYVVPSRIDAGYAVPWMSDTLGVAPHAIAAGAIEGLAAIAATAARPLPALTRIGVWPSPPPPTEPEPAPMTRDEAARVLAGMADRHTDNADVYADNPVKAREARQRALLALPDEDGTYPDRPRERLAAAWAVLDERGRR